MIDKEKLRKALGYPFTSKKEVLTALGYSDYGSVSKFFYGLARIGSKYWTDDVITRLLEEVQYDD